MTFHVWLTKNRGALEREATVTADAADDLPYELELQEPGWELVSAVPRLRKSPHDRPFTGAKKDGGSR